MIKIIDELELRQLITEYQTWCVDNNLTELGSADEHMFDANLTNAQRAWLHDFSKRWEKAGRIV